jgi:hypothetical protein
MCRPGIKASTVGGELSRKEQFEQLVNYLEHLHLRVRPVENTPNMAPLVDVLHEHT